MIDDEPEFEVERILDHRYPKKGRQRNLEYLLGCFGYVLSMTCGSMMLTSNVSKCAELVQEYWDATLPCICMHICVAYRGKRPTIDT